jgi:hypothetical protein
MYKLTLMALSFSVKSFHVLDMYFMYEHDEAVCIPEFRTLEPV